MGSAEFLIVIVPSHRESNLNLESDIAQCYLQKQRDCFVYNSKKKNSQRHIFFFSYKKHVYYAKLINLPLTTTQKIG